MRPRFFTAAGVCITLLCLVVTGVTPQKDDDVRRPGAAFGSTDSPQRGDRPESTRSQNGMDERILGPLLRAGYALNEESLLNALTQSDDLMVQAGAAYALGRLPKTERIVRALTSVVTENREGLSPSARDGREVVANHAIRSLIRLRDSKWVPAAVNHLPKVGYTAAQLELAGLLAQVGRYEGWDVVTSKVTDEKYTGAALEQVDKFKQMRDSSGRRKNLAEELNNVLPRASERSRGLIMKKINQLRADREGRP